MRGISEPIAELSKPARKAFDGERRERFANGIDGLIQNLSVIRAL